MDNAIFYRCEVCGNMVAMLKSGGGTLSCCGQNMTKLEPNTMDASHEKHVPVIEKGVGEINVTVGSVDHPMLAEHYIEWIALVTENQIEVKYLKPGMKPKARFAYYDEKSEVIYTGKDDEEVLNCEGQPCNFVIQKNPPRFAAVYAYCNLHGLWKTEL